MESEYVMHCRGGAILGLGAMLGYGGEGNFFVWGGGTLGYILD